MPAYEFVTRTQDAQVEALGMIELRDDGDARSFAGEVIRDLVNADRSAYCSWTLYISQDDRAVASIPFAKADAIA